MGFTDSLNLSIEVLFGILIFSALFVAIMPTAIEYVENASASVGMPATVTLVMSLILLAFVVGAFLKMFKKVSEPDRPEIQY
jgi:hypothetical protein